MTIEVDTVTAPEGWLYYLIYGDAGMMAEDDIAACDAWAARLSPWRVVDCERDENGEAIESRFSWNCRFYGAPYAGGNLIDYVIHKDTAPATLAQAAQALANC